MKNNDAKKIINERLNIVNEEIHCATFAIGDIFIKTHKFTIDNGIELRDDIDIEDWDRIIDYMFDYQCANAVKDELSLILYMIEHQSEKKEVKKEKIINTN